MAQRIAGGRLRHRAWSYRYRRKQRRSCWNATVS